MIGLLTAIFVASLLGSLHCIGMCGPIMTFAVSDHPRLAPRCAPQIGAVLAYHLGRLAVYVALGALSGALGGALNIAAGALAGIQQLATVAAGALLIGIGAASLLRHFAVARALPRMPRSIAHVIAAGHRFAATLPPAPRAALIGLLSGLIPCGWLYAFVVVAAGTGSGFVGAAVMLVFWGGTVPILTGLGLLVQRFRAVLGGGAEVVVSLALVALGLFALSGRLLALDRFDHERAPQLVSTAELSEQVTHLDSAKAPCCRGEP